MNYHHGIVMPGTVVAVPTTFTPDDQLVAFSTNSTDVKFSTDGSTILVINDGKVPAGYALCVAPKDLSRLLPEQVQKFSVMFNHIRSYFS